MLFDLRESGTCWVALALRFPDEPLTGYVVELVTDSNDPEQGNLPALGRRHTLGKVGPDGQVEGWLPTLGSAHVVVRGPTSIGSWRHPQMLHGLTLDARVRKDLVFETASLALHLPATLALPPKPALSLRFVDSIGLTSSFELSCDSEGIAQGLDGISIDARRILFARVPAGEHTFVLEIRDEEAPRTSAPILTHRTSVALPPGGRVELDAR